MKWIESLLIAIMPELLVQKTKLESIWNEQEAVRFRKGALILFSVAFFGYPIHYFFVDIPLDLQPIELWRNYRFAMTALSAVLFGFYFFTKAKTTWAYKLPALIGFTCFTYLQARTVLWYHEVPYLYAYIFVIVSTFLLRINLLKSFLYISGMCASLLPIFLQVGHDTAMIFSSTLMSVFFMLFVKYQQLSEVQLFLANHKHISAQKEIIEINIEFTNQIKAFLPKKVSERLTEMIQVKRMSVLQAIDEILRPHEKPVACMFSDIRGFTKKSADLEGYVKESLFPNLKAATKGVETFGGISRKIGDLIFAYFGDQVYEKNIQNCLSAAVEVSLVNDEHNASKGESQKINRHILLSCGPAVVGNLSSFDSAIEISAIGSPVNFLARLDEASKHESMKALLNSGDIIMSAEFQSQAMKIWPKLKLEMVSLAALGIEVRDFEDVEEVYIMPITKRNYNIIFEKDDETYFSGAA